MIAGTWSINEFIRKEPVLNGTVALNSMFCMPGYFLIEESSPTSAGNMEWFIKNLMSYEKKEAKENGETLDNDKQKKEKSRTARSSRAKKQKEAKVKKQKQPKQKKSSAAPVRSVRRTR